MSTQPLRMPPPASELPENRFEWEVEHNGELQTVSVPKLEYINPDSAAGKRSIEASTQKLTFLEQRQLVRDMAKLTNPAISDLIDSLDTNQIDWLSINWVEASAVTIPESSASSSSSETTEGPSKPTSSTKASASAGSAKRTSRSATSSRSSSTSRAKARSSGS